MNKQNRVDTCKTQCPKCKVFVSNLRKHKARGRCKDQHIRKKVRKFQLMAKKMEWLNPLPFYKSLKKPYELDKDQNCAFPVENTGHKE